MRQLVDVPLLISFERLVKKFMYLLDTASCSFPTIRTGKPSGYYRSRGSTKHGRSSLACATVTIWGAYHHPRALIELLGSTNHLVCQPNERAERFDKFTEYPYLLALLPHLRAMDEISKGKLTRRTTTGPES